MADIRHAPESFTDKLERSFRGRLRIRWSQQRDEWLIEQKVRRGIFPGYRATREGWDETSDRYVQHRDGVVTIMSVRTGDRMPCPRCSHELKVPYMETTHVKCAYCQMVGRRTYVPAVFFPLGDALIDHLKSIDPENPLSEKLAEDLDRQNEALVAQMEADAIRNAEAAMHERYLRLAGIPHVHYDASMFKMKKD